MAKTGPTAIDTKTVIVVDSEGQAQLFPTVEAPTGPTSDVIIDRYIQMVAIIINPNISAVHKVSLLGVLVGG